jgi:hypothetical protein
MRKRTYIHKSLITVYTLSSLNIPSQVSHAELIIAQSHILHGHTAHVDCFDL